MPQSYKAQHAELAQAFTDYKADRGRERQRFEQRINDITEVGTRWKFRALAMERLLTQAIKEVRTLGSIEQQYDANSAAHDKPFTT